MMGITPEEILEELRAQANPDNVAGMARFGINPTHTLGIGMPTLLALAKRLGKDHALAQALWDTGVHEARILAALVDRPAEVTEAQMEAWALDFDSWDVCDQVCGKLFDRTPFAYAKASAWSSRPEEFVKRAGFVLMASLATHDKKAGDTAFEQFLPLIAREAGDKRNFVKKAVNWALRGIGKRNRRLNALAVDAAQQIRLQEGPTARWVASDALRELTSEKTLSRIRT